MALIDRIKALAAAMAADIKAITTRMDNLLIVTPSKAAATAASAANPAGFYLYPEA